MNHFKLIVFTVFALALGAGLVAGKLDWTSTSAGPPRPVSSALAAQLDLTPVQCEQIRGIWEPLRQSARASYDQARRLERQRDMALESILTAEQKEKYGKIKHDYDDRVLELQARRDTAFRDAVERTRQLLSDPQRRKYEELIKDRLNPRETSDRPSSVGVAAANEGGTPIKIVP